MEPSFVPALTSRARVPRSRIVANNLLDKEYLPMGGLVTFRKLAAQLLFGDDASVLARVACVQTLSGTGALR